MQAKEAQGLSLWPFQRGEIKCFAVLGIMEGRESGGELSAMDELALEVERGSRGEFMMENKKGRWYGWWLESEMFGLRSSSGQKWKQRVHITKSSWTG